MVKSSRTRLRKSLGTVTVIESRVHRSARRHARTAFTLAFLGAGALTMLVASSAMRPILSLLLGVVIGLAAGATAWAVVRIWTFVRIIWWWLPELAIAAVVVQLWTMLVDQTSLIVRSVIVGAVVAVLALSSVRRVMASIGWCLVVRHRLRTCFAQFILANQSGSLPLIFGARPTPVGERAWIYLRPGLSISDLESRLDKIAVACHASAVLVARASTRTAGLVRVDIKRREVLGGTVGSPLTGIPTVHSDASQAVIPVSPAPAGIAISTPAKSGMDLPGLTLSVPAPPRAAFAASSRGAGTPADRKSATKGSPAAAGDEDLSDWLD